MQPRVTVFRPQRRGKLWTARADVRVGKETIHLTATATDRLVKAARQQVMQLGRDLADRYKGWIRYEPGAPTDGAFADVAGAGVSLVPLTTADPELDFAANFYREIQAGDRNAVESLQHIQYAAAQGDYTAQRQIDLLNTIASADTVDRERLAQDVIAGVPEAWSALGVMRARAPDHERTPTRVSWKVDDYAKAPPGKLGRDVTSSYASQMAQWVRPGASFGCCGNCAA